MNPLHPPLSTSWLINLHFFRYLGLTQPFTSLLGWLANFVSYTYKICPASKSLPHTFTMPLWSEGASRCSWITVSKLQQVSCLITFPSPLPQSILNKKARLILLNTECRFAPLLQTQKLRSRSLPFPASFSLRSHLLSLLLLRPLLPTSLLVPLLFPYHPSNARCLRAFGLVTLT